MKYLIICLLSGINFLLCAQGEGSDSVFNFLINNRSYNLKYGKIKDKNEYLSDIYTNFPLYTIQKQDFNDLKIILKYYEKKSILWDSLMKTYSSSDSIISKKEKSMNELISKEESRVNLYKNSYNDVVIINSQLNEQLKNCTLLAKKANKRTSIDNLLMGALGGIVCGIIAGVIIAR